MRLEEFLDKLEGVRAAGNGYVAFCPAHDDDNEPSLGITESHDGILLNCYAGCQTPDVLSALGLTFSDLFFRSHSVNYAEPEQTYQYTDELGNVLYEALRFPGKKFKQRHYDPANEHAKPDGWVWNLDGVRRVLYHLPEVIAAVAAGKTIYVTEGEKDADILRSLGKVATCNPMGAGKWRPEYAEFLRGAKIIVVRDRDDPGRAHAATIRDSLQGVAEIVWVVQARAGKDAADHLAAGYAVEDFEEARDRVKRGIVTSRQMVENARSDLELTQDDIPRFVLLPAVPLVFRLGRMYALGAYQGDGKTTFALQGTRQLASEGKRGGYFTLEMPERDLRNKLLAHHGIPYGLLEEPWGIKGSQYEAAYERGLAEMGEWNLDIIFESGVTVERIAEITRDREYEFVVVDHVHRMSWGERRNFENQLIALTNVALEFNVMLLILCQLRKHMRGKDLEAFPPPSIQDFRETSQIADDASIALSVWRQRDSAGMSYTGATQVQVLKNRHTTGPHDSTGVTFFPSFDPVRQIFVPGGFNA